METYYVLTWDVDTCKWSEQPGLSPGPYTFSGMVDVNRALKGFGYARGVDDVHVLVSPAFEIEKEGITVHDWLRWPKAAWQCPTCKNKGFHVSDPSGPKNDAGVLLRQCSECMQRKKRWKPNSDQQLFPFMKEKKK